MMDINYFLGIDLGTTNSVLSYINVTDDNKIVANIVNVPRISDTGSQITDKMLPSVVYYKKGKDGTFQPIVGDFAKAQYGKRQGFIIKSVKSSMGKDSVPDMNVDLPDQKPEDVSARILNQLIQGAKKKLMLDKAPDDVVITVPASFDGDQSKATLDAAQKAGIQAYGSHGKPKNILLYEPKAVLYDIVNSQMNGEIPSSIMDVSTPKNVLVYDIGGGTLDVSLHEISQGEKGELLNIKDLAISRYSQIGGDNFDAMIATHLCDEFLESTQGMFNVTEQVRKEIMATCLKKAEILKIEMNEAYNIMASRGQVLPDDHEESISEINLYNGCPFERYVTKAELLSFIQPLMGEGLSLASAKKMQSLRADQVDNIIYPILDVMVKAKAKCGHDVPIDYVVLNGGMSKFFPVVERLERFFGHKLITLNDPDMSVAKGAAIYHYYLHKYQIASHFDELADAAITVPEKNKGNEKKEIPVTQKPKAGKLIASTAAKQSARSMGHIQNDTLNLEVRGGNVYPIVPAGTPLPFQSEPLHVLMLPKDCDVIRLPLYYGSGHTTDWPNRKIAERRLRFRQTYPADTPISIQVAVDDFGIISIRTWITDEETELGTVTMASGQDERDVRNIGQKKAILPTGTQGMHLNFRAECNELAALVQRRNNARRQKNHKADSEISRQIKELSQRMTMATNPEDAGTEINSAFHRYSNLPTYQSILFGVGGKLYSAWDWMEKHEFHQRCQSAVRSILQNRAYSHILDFHFQAINALAAIGAEEDCKSMIELLESGDKRIAPQAAVALAKMKADATPIIKAFLGTNEYDIPKLDSYAWAIGKLCSREVGTYHNMSLLKDCAKRCFRYLNSDRLRNYNIKSTLLYTIGEICDARDTIAQPLPVSYSEMALKSLQDFSDEISYTEYENICSRKLNLAITMVKGLPLDDDDDAQLLALRQRFDE
ncbi:Hsp70 family protein [uncultured Megasphaera sp.]|uniref:Hsp70 family protein n=1 Tax=uncultured Megasphaera sp. TaxID=165188 RepID=UPI0025F68284|nr:Hsp70 family protein [uncultured Megasphaera sp.]